MQNDKRTLVEEGTELKGTLRSSCPVVVNGAIDGQIEAPALTVTQSGTVLGNVKARELRSDGTLAGDIDADDVYLSGTVRSNTIIRAKTLEVKLAPERGKLEVTFGECVLDVGDEPKLPEEVSEADGAGTENGAADGAVHAAEGAPEAATAEASPAASAEAGGADTAEASEAAPPDVRDSEWAEEEGATRRRGRRGSNRHSQPPPS